MRYVEAGDLRLSVIGLGTWQFGSREWGYGDEYAREVAPAILRRAVELGVTLIDTAEVYAFGGSERIVGATLRTLEPDARAGLTVATKLLPVMPLQRVVDFQVAGSLRRLGVDELDLYQAHWPNPFASPKATMKPLRHLLADGRVRHVGVSNYPLERWQASERALRAPVLTNQVQFSLANPAPAHDLVPYARGAGRIVIAYSPLGQGLLTSAVPRVRKGMLGRLPAFAPKSQARLEPLRAVIASVAEAHGATRAQVALAWLIEHGNVVAIPGARTLEQLEQNVAAAELRLTADEQQRLAEAAAWVR